MSASDDSPGRLTHWWSLTRTYLRSIRARIILPYAILTVLVAFAGTYIVTTLVQGSLEEQLRRELGEAADVASDQVALFESTLTIQQRELTYLQGAYEAMRDGDYQALQELLVPSVGNSAIQRTIVTDLTGKAVLDIVLWPDEVKPQPGGSLTGRDLSMVPQVYRVLQGDDDQYGDRYAGLVAIEDQLYLAISGPFRIFGDQADGKNELVGVVMVAEPLSSLLNQIQEAAVVRRVTVYGYDGQIVETTLEDQPITPALVQTVLSNTSQTPQEERTVLGRRYRFAYFVFQVRYEPLGVMSVGLQSGHVAEGGQSGRLRFSIIFTLAVVAVIGIGLLVSRRIIVPIIHLIQTSRAVAQGDLSQRTGIRSDDEIGKLAETFDDMTDKLAHRTTELERLLREKREESSRMQAILSSISEGVLMEDKNNQIAMMNRAAQEMLEVLAEQFRAMQPVREVETTSDARRFEIGERIISVETSPVLMPDGKHLGRVMVIRDITRETEADRLKDEFITQISHELRTPLTSIKGYSDLLLRAVGGSGGDQERGFLQTINRHADSLVDMITDLLDFTQLEAGNLGLRFEPMTMESVIQRTAEKWAESFKEKNIRFSVQIDDPIPQMLGDERRLRRALSNLVENAYNYTLEGGEVILSLRASDHIVTVTVKDTGVGIAPEDQAFLFTRFYRVSIERTIDVRGAGLGLYVAKAIVEGHGGEIWVESELGQGSTFGFSVPLDRDQKPPAEIFTDLGDLLR